MKLARLILLTTAPIFLISPGGHSGAEPQGAAATDGHTVALWLFDDPLYPLATLTDAGPYRNDLRLVSGYAEWWAKTGGKGTPDEEPLHMLGGTGLVPGKFGGALRLPAGAHGEVIWPGSLQRYGTAYLTSRGNEISERLNLGYLDWTLEFWFGAAGDQARPCVIFELRNEKKERGTPMANALKMDHGRIRFILSSRTITDDPGRRFDLELPIPTDPARLNDGGWHHLAFTFTAAERQLRHYVDGRLQPLPEKGGFLPMIGQLISLHIGDGLHGLLDEMRISDLVRYTTEFSAPGSLSRNFGPNPPLPNHPDGPPPLFPPDSKAGEPVQLGSRKHVFIDNALIEQMTNLELKPNPPASYEVSRFVNDRPWEPTPRFGSTLPDICSVWDEGNEIRMLYTNGGMWGAKPQALCLATSKNGLDWEKPVLNLESWDGSTQNNIVLRDACQGSVIKDPNPLVPPEERYKYVAWCFYRGFYVYTSPDAIHWRRNESCALPFDPDGSISCFWDDQCGIYRGFIRSAFDSGDKRRTSRISIPQLLKPWPFRPAARPDLGDMELARPVSGELPLIDTGGQVYRFKAHKYSWAPDTYVAFPWRYLAGANVRPGSFLMVSRNGENWKRYENPYYFAAGGKMGGRTVMEALMEHGMVRRGDEIWQFGTVRFTEHGGVLYGGVEHEGGVHDRLLKLVQRLDGFVSLDAADAAGSVVTKPFVFQGRRLELNISVRGSARVALLDASGRALEGFGFEDCDPIQGDSVRRIVAWRGKTDVSRLAGTIVRLSFALKSAKLYAFQFDGQD